VVETSGRLLYKCQEGDSALRMAGLIVRGRQAIIHWLTREPSNSGTFTISG